MRGVIAIAVLAAAGCRGNDTCLGGTCPTPCAKLVYQCEPSDVKPLYIGQLRDLPPAYALQRGNGAADDLAISNGVVTAVISAPAHDSDLAPTGGNLIDYGPAGGIDDVTIVYQLAGILPDDAFAYTTLEQRQLADRVEVTLRGTLAGRPEVEVATHYELGSCDPGVRVRSELFNGSADTQAWFVGVAAHWGKRRVLPFSPGEGRGFLAPELELLDLATLWRPRAFDAGATPANNTPGYATVACEGELSGVDDPEIAAVGTAMTLVAPGDTLVFERMIATGGAGAGPRAAIDTALDARSQLHAIETVAVAGRIVAGGMPFGGDVRRASVIIKSDGVPVTSTIPAADGSFRAKVPAGELEIEVWSFGRVVATVSAPGGVAGTIEVPLTATVTLHVTDGVAAIHALVAFHPAADATRAAVTGSFHGRGECAPWLGPDSGASPACNRVLVDPQGTDVEVPAGRYLVVATAGPEHMLGKSEVTLAAGEVTPIDYQLEPVPLVPAGWVSADLHVHGRASFDSGLPDDDRVRSFAAAGVQVIAATDHDVIGDYTQTVGALGLEDRIAVLGGLEATQLIPWMDVPGHDVPRVIGHFNFFPLTRRPEEPRAGAPSDEGIEPGTLFDRMAPLVGDGGFMMLNHPWDEPTFGRDLGYLRAIDFDPRLPILAGHKLLERPSGGHRNLDWNLIEVINGPDTAELQKGRVLWFSLLGQGFVVPGAGNSDSHSLSDTLGWARNWVDAGIPDIAHFSQTRFASALRLGRFVAGNGVVVRVELVDAGGQHVPVSIAPYHAHAADRLSIVVTAPPWIPVEEVRVVTSRGTRVLASGAELSHPADPFVRDGIERFRRDVLLTDLVERDDFIVVEAGVPYPLAADLDDDGVVDTADNNRDGVVDQADVEEDEDTGPIGAPPDPTDPADPRFWVTRVVPGAVPEGFANPVLVDLDGNGWTPPGVPVDKRGRP